MEFLICVFYLQARFHSMHVGTCSSFAIDISHNWPYPSTCLNKHPTSNYRDMSNEEVHDEYAELEEKTAVILVYWI